MASNMVKFFLAYFQFSSRGVWRHVSKLPYKCILFGRCYCAVCTDYYFQSVTNVEINKPDRNTTCEKIGMATWNLERTKRKTPRKDKIWWAFCRIIHFLCVHNVFFRVHASFFHLHGMYLECNMLSDSYKLRLWLRASMILHIRFYSNFLSLARLLAFVVI